MKGICGIDPGLQGGIAIRGDEIRLLTQPLPLLDNRLDLRELRLFLEEHRHSIDKAYIEEVHAVFGSSAKNTFEFGRICGQLEAMLSSQLIPFEYVKPMVWQKEFFSLGGKLDPKQRKERCVLAAQRLWPDVVLTSTNRSRVPHTGMVDALLIAEYGWRKK